MIIQKYRKKILKSNYLVSDEHLDNVLVGRVGLQLVEPVLDLGEGLPTGDVVDDDDSLTSPVVARRQSPESLLPGSVPDGQLHLELNRLLEANPFRTYIEHKFIGIGRFFEAQIRR